jgi:hypothetical protein
MTINDEPIPENAVVVVEKVEAPLDQRVVTAREGRRTWTKKHVKTTVSSEEIKDGNPLAVRDQLMRDYFDLRRNMDEVVQKLCALVFKHH